MDLAAPVEDGAGIGGERRERPFGFGHLAVEALRRRLELQRLEDEAVADQLRHIERLAGEARDRFICGDRGETVERELDMLEPLKRPR